MTDQTTACHSTQHCATHDFCHRCAPSLHKATQHLVKAIDAAGIEYRASGRVYAQLAATVRDAARTASGQQPETTPTPQLRTCSCGLEAPHTFCPAVGQPAEAQATCARNGGCDRVVPCAQPCGTDLLAEVDRQVRARAAEQRAAVLGEAMKAVHGRVEAYEGMGQDAVDRNRERAAIADMLRRMAEEARS